MEAAACPRLRRRAAVRIQTAWRNWLAAAALQRLARYTCAAVAVQRAWRTFLVGRRVGHAACCVTRVVRAWLLRRRLRQFQRQTFRGCSCHVYHGFISQHSSWQCVSRCWNAIWLSFRGVPGIR